MMSKWSISSLISLVDIFRLLSLSRVIDVMLFFLPFLSLSHCGDLFASNNIILDHLSIFDIIEISCIVKYRKMKYIV